MATLAAIVVAIFGNRVLAILVGLWFYVPALLLLSVLIALDLIQIPLFYWIYSHSTYLLAKLPPPCRKWFEKDWTQGKWGKWVSSLGSFGVMLVSFLPSFGGGIWSAVFLAYTLRLRREMAFLWVSLGSILSYIVIYFVGSTLVAVVRYFSN